MTMRDRANLITKLEATQGFLTRSAAAFVEGWEDEARRMATAARVLLHGHGRSSRSLLGMLGMKKATLFVDTHRPADPRDLFPTGLAFLRLGSSGGPRWTPPLDDALTDLDRTRPPVEFNSWWEGTAVIVHPDTKDSWTRWRVVRELSNKEGGAHVDPHLTEEYEDLADMGWVLWARSSGSYAVLTRILGRRESEAPTLKH